MFQMCLLLILIVGLFSFLAWLFGKSTAGRSTRSNRLFLPRLEALEARIVMSSVQSYDLFKDALPSNPQQFVDGGNGIAYFIATVAVDRVEILKSINGANPVPLYDLTQAGASLLRTCSLNGLLYFMRPRHGRELWVAGTVDGGPPRLLADINAGPNGSNSLRLRGGLG